MFLQFIFLIAIIILSEANIPCFNIMQPFLPMEFKTRYLLLKWTLFILKCNNKKTTF